MTTAYKPGGYASVSAYMVVDDAQRLIDFLRATFAAEVTRRFDNDAGSLMHGEVKIDDTVRRAGIKDPTGNIWWIATQIE